MNDFYVGYLPEAPQPLRMFLRKLVRVLLMFAVVVSLALVNAQGPFAASAFEFQQEREFQGTIEVRPYAALVVQRPGNTSGADSGSRYWLVAPGKHGADAIIRGFEGRQVALKGKLIYRSQGTMIEVVPSSLRPQPGASNDAAAALEIGPATLTGEIVDTKCYLGVMNPGSGKVHRECAARCLSGGIPPAFLAQSSPQGEYALYELTSTQGGPLPRRLLLQHVAERLTLSGHLVRIGSTEQFRIDPDLLR